MTQAPSPAGLAIVTGTSAGIGQHVALLLLDLGWEVVGLARRSTPVSHQHYHHLAVDLRDTAALEALAAERLEPLIRDPRWTRIGLVNNAAAADRLGPLERLTPTALASTHAVNTVAPMALMALVSRVAQRGTPIRIVNVSSGAATAPFPGLGVYCASKAALRMAGMVMAEEWKSDAPHAPTRADAGILSYEPGIVDTEMQVGARSHDPADFPWVAMFESFQAKGMLVPPELPAADIVAFLGSVTVTYFSESHLGG
jgi:benzil reductase ((S)-benzoin forming)